MPHQNQWYIVSLIDKSGTTSSENPLGGYILASNSFWFDTKKDCLKHAKEWLKKHPFDLPTDLAKPLITVHCRKKDSYAPTAPQL